MLKIKLRRRVMAGASFVLAAFFVSSSPQSQSVGWDGFYAGVSTIDDALTITTSQSTPGGLATAQTLGFFPLRTAPNSGFIGGVQAGYDRMIFDGIYARGETDFQWLSAQTTVASSPIVSSQQAPMTVTRSQTWLGTTRAKIGFTPMS